MFKKYKIVLAGILLTGCATQPIATSNAVPVPEKRILDVSLMQRAQNSGEVIVKRDKGFKGSGCVIRTYIDAKPVADIDTGEKVVLYLNPGDHIISVEQGGICGGVGMVETKVSVQSGVTYSYRIAYGSNFEFGIYPTAF